MRPALVRSRIRPRSNSASAAKKDELAAGRRAVDHLGEAPDSDASLLQVADDLDQMGDGAPEPVQAPNSKDILRADVGERLRQSRPVNTGARKLVAEDSLAPGSLQGVDLQVEQLIRLRGTCVAY
jgi:hypothetical protein